MKLPILWKCADCGATHEDRHDAAYCCGPLERYACPTCNDDDWETEADALACCHTGEDEQPKDPTPEELEKAGQQRLIP